MINTDDGSLVFEAGLMVKAGMTQADLIVQFGIDEIDDLENAWVHLRISEIRCEDKLFNFTFYCQNGVLKRIQFGFDIPEIVESTSWDDYSEDTQIAIEAAYDAWLGTQIGDTRKFAWGSISPFFDRRGGSTNIWVYYND